MRARGFSLLELIVVIAIIAILIAIAIPSYQIYTRRAHYTEIIQAAVPYRIGIEECFEITGSLGECVAGKNGVPSPVTHDQSSSLVDSINVFQHGQIIVTPQAKYGIKPKDTYTLTPKIYKNKLTWTHGGGGVAKGYVN